MLKTLMYTLNLPDLMLNDLLIPFFSFYFLLVSCILYICIKVEKYIIFPVNLKFLPVWRCYLFGLFISMI